MFHDMGGLKSAGSLAVLRVRLHGDSHRLPVFFGEAISLPPVEQPRVSTTLGISDAGPQLPAPVCSLPDREIHRLLLRVSQLAEVWISRDPPFVKLGNHPPVLLGNHG